jgi:mono/diheme cytochrome c family protein
MRPGKAIAPLARRLLAAAVVLAAAPSMAAEPDGAALYASNCAPCHGTTGRGNGPRAALFERRPPALHEAVSERSTDAVVRRILDGGSLQLPLDLPALRARATDTQQVIGYLRRLPQIDWVSVDAGAAVYGERCEVCHGAFGRPPAVLPPGVRAPRDLSEPIYQAMSNAELVAAVRHGRDGMPALIPRLSDGEARAAAAYVRLMSPGFEIYSQYCAACHGTRGRGGGGPGAPAVVFDGAYFTTRDPEELRRGVWHMVDEHRSQMRHFRADLSPAEAAAIVEWLRSQPWPGGGASRAGADEDAR